MESFSTGLKINFSINEKVVQVLKEDKQYFLGKGDLIGWYSQDDISKRIHSYHWHENISYLTISYWYLCEPDGLYGSVWVANNRFVYLGSY